MALGRAAATSCVCHARFTSGMASVAASAIAPIAAVAFAVARAAATACEEAVVANIGAEVHGHVQAVPSGSS